MRSACAMISLGTGASVMSETSGGTEGSSERERRGEERRAVDDGLRQIIRNTKRVTTQALVCGSLLI